MATKGEKIKPVVLPDELYEMCNWKEEPLLQQLHDGLTKCKTVYEEMNCFGLLKQEIRLFLLFLIINRIILFYEYNTIYFTCLYSSILPGFT